MAPAVLHQRGDGMSDYLGNLVARHFEAAPSIRPRLTSLFEPSSGTQTSMHQPPVEIETAPADVTPNESMPELDTQAHAPRRVEFHPVRMDAQVEPAALGADTETPSLDVPVRAPDPRAIDPTAPVAQRPLSKPLTLDPAAAKSEKPAMQEPLPVLRPAIDQNDRASSDVAYNPNRLTLERDFRRIVDERLAVADMRRYAPDRSAELRNPEPVLPMAPLRAPSQHTPVVKSLAVPGTVPITEPAVAPTIRVTIGRIDVRAVMPTPGRPRSKPAERRPALLLDEYLKQRSGGSV